MDEHDLVLGTHIQELRRGTVVLAVLALLQESDYGYNLLEGLRSTGFDVDANTLYPLLRRLEKQGLLSSDWDTSGGRPRKYYRTSDLGTQVLGELAEEWNRLDARVKAIVEKGAAS